MFEKLAESFQKSSTKYIEILNSQKEYCKFTWEIVETPVFEKENELYACKNVKMDTIARNYMPGGIQEISIALIGELNKKYEGKHLLIHSIIETRPQMIDPNNREGIIASGQRVTVPIYNPYMYEDQVFELDGAYVLQDIVFKLAILGEPDTEIISGTKEQILRALKKEVKTYPADGIVQEVGLYEMKHSSMESQIDNAKTNPFGIFLYSANKDANSIIGITMISKPVYLKKI